MSTGTVISALAELADKADEKGLRDVADSIGIVMAGMSSGCIPMLELDRLSPISKALASHKDLLRMSRTAESCLWKIAAAESSDPIMAELKKAVNLYQAMLAEFKSTKKVNATAFQHQFQGLLSAWKQAAAQRGANVSEPKMDASSAQAYLNSAENALRQIYASINAWGRLGEISKQKEEERKDTSVFRPFFYQKPGLANQVVSALEKWQSKLPKPAQPKLNELINQIRSLAPTGKTAAAHFDFGQVIEMRFSDLDRLFENAFGTWLKDPEVKAFVSSVKTDLKGMWDPETIQETPPTAPPTGPAPQTQPTQYPQAQPTAPQANALPPVATAVQPTQQNVSPANRVSRPRGIKSPTVPVAPALAVPNAPVAPAVQAPKAAPTAPEPKAEEGEVAVPVDVQTVKDNIDKPLAEIMQRLKESGYNYKWYEVAAMAVEASNTPDEIAKFIMTIPGLQKASPEKVLQRMNEKGHLGESYRRNTVLKHIFPHIRSLASEYSLEQLQRNLPLQFGLSVPNSVLELLYKSAQGGMKAAAMILGPRLAKGVATKIL